MEERNEYQKLQEEPGWAKAHPSLRDNDLGALTPDAVLELAAKIYKQRSSKYGDEWQSRGWRGSLSDVMRKAGRIRRHIWEAQGHESFVNHYEFDLDDVYDLINYCAFMIANYENGNEWGQ